MDIYELEEKLRKPRKKRVKVKVVGKSVFKLRNLISNKLKQHEIRSNKRG